MMVRTQSCAGCATSTEMARAGGSSVANWLARSEAAVMVRPLHERADELEAAVEVHDLETGDILGNPASVSFF